jgi:hypothetical protein
MVSFDSFNPEHVPSAKLATHALQIVLGFVAWCMEIAVFTNDEATITGQIGWTFAVVRLFCQGRRRTSRLYGQGQCKERSG